VTAGVKTEVRFVTIVSVASLVVFVFVALIATQ